MLGDRLSAATVEQRDWHLLFFELWQRTVRSGAPGGALRDQRASLHAAMATAI